MARRPTSVHLAIAVVVALAATTCATAPRPRGERDVPTERPALTGATDAIRAELGAGARSLLGATELVVKGRRFTWDCTGTVLAIYWYAGIDLARDFGRYAGGGVSRLYRTLKDASLLYTTREPILGDLVFWDDTYDADGDGAWDDPLTHVGMVMETAADGTVSYVHLNYRKGIVIERMNLREPDVYQRMKGGEATIVNSPLRMAGAGTAHPDRWLAGQLYRVLGMGYLITAR
jgi:hypothetical protein